MQLKFKRRITLLALLVCALLTTTVCASNETSFGNFSAQATLLSNTTSVENQTTDFYVNDFAEIFNESQHRQLMERAVDFEQETGGVQIVITTVSSLNGSTIEDYAYSMYNKYGIGKQDMGVLILFSSGDREIRIEPGLGMEAYLTDSISGELIDNNALDDFKADHFAVGLIKLQIAVMDYTTNHVPIPWKTSSAPASTERFPSQVDDGTQKDSKTAIDGDVIAIAAILLGFVISLIFAIKNTVALNRYKEKYKQAVDDLEEHKKSFREKLQANRDEHSKELESVKKQCSDGVRLAKREYQDMLTERENTIMTLHEKLQTTHQKADELSSIIDSFELQFKRVKMLYPAIDVELAELVEREHQAEAAEIDRKLTEVISLRPDKNQVQTFRNACDMLSGLKSEVMQYIKTDPETIEKLYTDSQALLREYEQAEKEKADQATATLVTDRMNSLLKKYNDGNYSNYQEFSPVFQQYERLTQNQKKYVPQTTRVEFFRLYSSAKEEHTTYTAAKEVEEKVSQAIGHMYRASEHDLDRLKRAMSEYKRLNAPEAAYFDSALLSRLKSLIRQAEDDKQEQERARRRRMAESTQSSSTSFSSSSFGSSRSSFGGHSGFSGHGGRSSGGGASRKF